ncbi:chorismate mutase [Streptococcus dentapri]|uniref:Chorismate mutase n=1 Tax=Streptococcus dentapri TaxID=573564 RepID=A0ABV8D3E8_9STRE
MNLENIRENINSIDKELVALIEQRMTLVSQVAAVKKETSKAIFDKEREEAILARVADQVANKELEPFIVAIFVDIMKVSRVYQEEKLK